LHLSCIDNLSEKQPNDLPIRFIRPSFTFSTVVSAAFSRHRNICVDIRMLLVLDKRPDDSDQLLPGEETSMIDVETRKQHGIYKAF